MDPIHTLLRRASRRVELSLFLLTFSRAAAGGAAAAVLLVLADHVPGRQFVPWRYVLPALIVLVCLVTLIRWLQCRPALMRIAIAVDERLGLRERLSTALQCADRDDAFAQAAVNDAAKAAADANTSDGLRQAFAIRLPRSWWAGPLLASLAALALMMPQLGWVTLAQNDEELIALAKPEEATEAELTLVTGDVTFRPTPPRADLGDPNEPADPKPRSGSGARIGPTGADPTSPDAKPGSGRQVGIDAKGSPGGAEGDTGDASTDAEAGDDADFGPEEMAPPVPDTALPPEDEQKADPEPGGGGGDQTGEKASPVSTPIQPTPTLERRIRVPSKTSPGATIIAQQWVNLALMRGDWSGAIRRMNTMLVEKLEEGFDEQDVPAKYREAQKHYFGELKPLIDSSKQDAKQPSRSDNTSGQ